jgi:hypothetical protein
MLAKIYFLKPVAWDALLPRAFSSQIFTLHYIASVPIAIVSITSARWFIYFLQIGRLDIEIRVDSL